MQLFLNKFKYGLTLSLIFLFNLNSMAQEEFLQLDSIVIKQGELTITKIPNRSWEYEGHDTINVNQSNQQIILVRYCGITMSNNSSTFGGNVSITSYNKLYDLKISTQLFNLLNAMNHETAAPRSLDGGSSTIMSRQRVFESRPNIFLAGNENIYVDYIQEYYQYGPRAISYRIELIYYSYD